MSHRALLAARGGASFIPPTPTVFEITAAPDGAWTFPGPSPSHIRYGDYSYIGYVDTSGNVALRVVTNASLAVGSEIILHEALNIDDHVNPAFLVRASDHKLIAWYAKHEPASTTIHQRISTNSLDTDPTLSGGFAAETDLDAQMGGTSYDYPVPAQLSNGDIHLYYRDIPSGSNYRLTRSISTDGAATWGAQTVIYANSTHSGRAYWSISQHGDRVDFAVTDGAPNIEATSLAHFYWSAGSFYKTDGTLISVSPPLVFTDFTQVYDGTTVRCWVYTVAYDGTRPYAVYPTFLSSFTDHRYNYARWSGSAWVSTEICAAGTGIDSATLSYSAGLFLDEDAPSRVFACRQVASKWGLYRYVTSDNGATFTGTLLEEDASAKYVRPRVIRNAHAKLRAVALKGTYTGYQSFSMGIVGTNA